MGWWVVGLDLRLGIGVPFFIEKVETITQSSLDNSIESARLQSLPAPELFMGVEYRTLPSIAEFLKV